MGKKTLVIALGAVFLLAVLGILVLPRIFHPTGAIQALNDDLDDQHMKTTLALLELHRARTGRYPDSLKDLKFVGSWDLIALGRVHYFPNPDRSAYYIDIRSNKPEAQQVEYPPEFWQGTGYKPELRPAGW
jgi:hypothetical protein